MNRKIVAILVLLAVAVLTGCNNKQAETTSAQQSPSQQQDVVPTPSATQNSVETPAPVRVVFKTDPKNLLPEFTLEDLSRKLNERHGLEKLRGKRIRLKARVQDTPLSNTVSFLVNPEPFYFDKYEVVGFGDSVLDNLYKGEGVEIVCVFTGLGHSTGNGMEYILKGKELHQSD